MAVPYVARVYMNSKQKKLLVEFMERHKDFATNRLNANYPSQIRNRLWQELTGILNAERSGVAKQTEGWKKSWKELKSSVKEKATKMRAIYRMGAEEGRKRPRAVPLTHLEERVLVLLGLDVPGGATQNAEDNEGCEEYAEVSPLDPGPESSSCREINQYHEVVHPSETHLVQILDSRSLLVETHSVTDSTISVSDDCCNRPFLNKQERSPSPLEQPDAHDKLSGMYFESCEQQQQQQEQQHSEHFHQEYHQESAFYRLAAAQEELVAIKRIRYQQKKDHDDAILSVFKEFVDCIKNAFPQKK